MKNNYRIDVFMNTKTYYSVEFPEYWLALCFGNSVKQESGVSSVYLLERMSDDKFDITRKI